MDYTRLGIVVHSRKTLFGFSREDAGLGVWHVHIRSAPLRNEANREIERECSLVFGTPVRIIRGARSVRKTILIGLSPEKVKQILSKKSSDFLQKKS
ncbi:MAG: DUF167 domain-containing protein [Candidatus Diapherotrites archaeon]